MQKVKRVNVGTVENPVFISEEQVTGPSTMFSDNIFEGIVNGDVKVGGNDGVNLDRVLAIANKKPTDNSGRSNA